MTRKVRQGDTITIDGRGPYEVIEIEPMDGELIALVSRPDAEEPERDAFDINLTGAKVEVHG